MKISKNTSTKSNNEVFEKAKCKYAIAIPTPLIDFLCDNNGGKPIKKYIQVEDESYTVRTFLSLDPKSEYFIEKPMEYFLDNTKKRIIPFGIDESSNYFCFNLENGKIYYWCAESDKYYLISKNIDEFCQLFS